jgi:hypothetical protein
MQLINSIEFFNLISNWELLRSIIKQISIQKLKKEADGVLPLSPTFKLIVYKLVLNDHFSLPYAAVPTPYSKDK